MVSNAIASLDAWLQRAEKVLQEQREHALSPGGDTWWDQGQERTRITVKTLAAGLPQLLDSLCRRPGRWILIVEDDLRRQRAWQALAFEDGSLVTEVISNHYLPVNDRWTDDQHRRLVCLDWGVPDPPRRTNWVNVQATTSPDVGGVARQGIATLRKVFGLSDQDNLFVKMFSSALRGDTPAGGTYFDQTDEFAADIDTPLTTCEGSVGMSRAYGR